MAFDICGKEITSSRNWFWRFWKLYTFTAYQLSFISNIGVFNQSFMAIINPLSVQALINLKWAGKLCFCSHFHSLDNNFPTFRNLKVSYHKCFFLFRMKINDFFLSSFHFLNIRLGQYSSPIICWTSLTFSFFQHFHLNTWYIFQFNLIFIGLVIITSIPINLWSINNITVF